MHEPTASFRTARCRHPPLPPHHISLLMQSLVFCTVYILSAELEHWEESDPANRC